MQFSSAFLVTSFITFVSGVNCASFAFYENMALGCTDKDPGDLLVKNVRCNICIDPNRGWFHATCLLVS
ncbi:hypothetical protein BDQ17DRAFT_1351532 [Cyathus striatus]|nr:hypothetical protein BDQ17DRAFT_1351532 [Cyathus striatus]